MQTIKKLLSSRLAGAKRVAVLAIGSEFRADDAAGLIAGDSISRRSRSRKLKVFMGGTAPENLTGEIRSFKPSHIIIIDTAEMKESPGTVLLLKPEELSKDITFSTHKMPAEVLIEYFIKSMGASVTFIGIQPKTIKFGQSISNDVKGSANEVARAILGAIK